MASSLLVEAREGRGMRYAVQYSSSSDERMRDRGAQRADVMGVPFVMPSVKGLFTELGLATASLDEFRYHGAALDPMH